MTPSDEIVCHISFNHDPFDDRIYWKELLALTKAGYRTVHIAVGDKQDDYISADGVRIIIVKRTKIVQSLYGNKLLQTIFKKKGTIGKLLRIAMELKAIVYHYHDFQLNSLAKSLAQLEHKPLVIYDSHEAYHLLYKKECGNLLKNCLNKIYLSIISRWEIRNAAYCHHIIAPVPYIKEYFNKEIPSVPCSIIYNYSFFEPVEEISDKEYDFIYAGLLSKKEA